MSQSIPKITIVTVVYNGQTVIENTIESVLGQTYSNLEYLVIDGSSKDNTLEIVKKFQHKLNWISEPDEGVYHAMNKGIQIASGEWILFMNAGDFFYSNTVIADIFVNNKSFEEYSVLYGDAEFRLKNIAYISEANPSVNSNQYMPFSHQAAFTRTSVAKKNTFDLEYKIAADTAFFLRLVKENHTMKHLPIIVCSYNALEGLSADNEVERSKEIVALQAKWNGIDPNDQHFVDYINDARKKERIRKIIPNFIWIKLREMSAKKKYDKVYNIR